MDGLLLSRIQFGLTAGFHFIFPSLTVGLGWLIFLLMSFQLATGRDIYKQMFRFWIRVFALTFAVGVATGIVLEFEFGTNWANYSRFVGDIFGAPLAIEGVFAFFLESSFLGLLIFGEKRLSPKVHWFSALMVAVGATMSAFWILAANSWQHTPEGYEMVNGRAVLTDFWAAVFNRSTNVRFGHVVVATIIGGAFLMTGVGAYYTLKKRHTEFAKKCISIGLVIGLITSVGQLVVGHFHSIQIWRDQPIKLAAVEGHFETESHAPLLIFGIPNAEERRTDYAIAVPGFMSFLLTWDFETEVKGLNEWPKEDWPPLMLTFFPYHLMFILGTLFIAFTALGVFLLWRKKLFDPDWIVSKWFLRLAVLAIPLPVIANELGWMTTEIGRQPWIVYGMLRTSDGYSANVPPEHILFSIIAFGVIYILLFAVWLFLLVRKIKHGPEPIEAAAKEVQS